MKNVVVFGGANGTSLVLRALKPHVHEVKLSAVVSMSDSGRSSAKMRDEVGALPSADILRVLLALSQYDYETIKELLYARRLQGHEKLSGFNIGTLFIGLASQYTGDIVAVIRALEEVLQCVGTVYPATLDHTHLNVRLDTGALIHGEGMIDDPALPRGPTITEAWLDPGGALYSGAKLAIEAADYILIGPGDLYTSNIASFLARGTKESITHTRAKLLFIAGNKYTTDGEFAPITLSARVAALEQYLPRPVDVIFYNDHAPTKEETMRYQKESWGLIENDFIDPRVRVLDFEAAGGGLSEEKLGSILMNYIHEI